MDGRLITPQVSREVVELLVNDRGWSAVRIARTIDAEPEFIKRVQAGKQCFESRDIDALAKASGQKAYKLLFDAVSIEDLPQDLRGLYELTRKEIARHEQLSGAVLRKSTKKRRVRTKAA